MTSSPTKHVHIRTDCGHRAGLRSIVVDLNCDTVTKFGASCLEKILPGTTAFIFSLGNDTYTLHHIHTPVGGQATADGSVAHHNVHLF